MRFIKLFVSQTQSFFYRTHFVVSIRTALKCPLRITLKAKYPRIIIGWTRICWQLPQFIIQIWIQYKQIFFSNAVNIISSYISLLTIFPLLQKKTILSSFIRVYILLIYMSAVLVVIQSKDA